jgi:hypothetical protein
VFFATIITLNEEGSTDGERFEGIGLRKWNFMSEHHVRGVIGFGILAYHYPAVARIRPRSLGDVKSFLPQPSASGVPSRTSKFWIPSPSRRAPCSIGGSLALGARSGPLTAVIFAANLLHPYHRLWAYRSDSRNGSSCNPGTR